MAYKIQTGEIMQVRELFGEIEIWTQSDIMELTGLTQPAVSTALSYLEEQGEVIWNWDRDNEGPKKVKFYTGAKHGC